MATHLKALLVMVLCVLVAKMVVDSLDVKSCRKLLRRVILSTTLPIFALTFSTTLPVAANAAITSRYENYVPRILYPGTYANYCGPTPEMSPEDSCRGHGWHGDNPVDEVDEACRLHDTSYCNCDAGLRARKGFKVPLLSSLTALRFVTDPVLRAEGVDGEYFSCVNKADRQLISSGLKIRGEQQRTNCEGGQLGWFCNKDGGKILSAFEKVSLRIFLRSLDYDENNKSKYSGEKPDTSSLSRLEESRQMRLAEGMRSGKGFAGAAAGEAQEAEERMLLKLAAEQ
jgi:hypothetical protein